MHLFPRYWLTFFVDLGRRIESIDATAANLHISRWFEDYAGAFDNREGGEAAALADQEPDWIGAWTRALQNIGDEEQRESLFARIDKLQKAYTRLRRHPEPAAAARIIGLFVTTLADELAKDPEGVSWRASDLLDYAHSALARLHFAYDAAKKPKRIQAEDLQWDLIDRDFFAADSTAMTRVGPVRLRVLRFASRKWLLVPTWPGPAGRTLENALDAPGIAAATNGGYYVYSERARAPHAALGDPVGLSVRSGVILMPPIYQRPALMQDEENHIHIRTVGLKGLTMRREKMKLAARLINRRQVNPGDIVFYNSLFGERTPDAPMAFAVYGRRVIATATDSGVAIPLGGLAVALHPGGPSGGAAFTAIGDEWDFDLPSLPGVGRVMNAVAGGPMILAGKKPLIDWEHGEYDAAAAPEALHPHGFFAQALSPRLAVGVTEDHQVVMVAVEGRDFRHSVGMHLDMLSRLLLDLGCTHALNLDGGGSVGMAVRGDEKGFVPGDRPIRSLIQIKNVKA